MSFQFTDLDDNDVYDDFEQEGGTVYSMDVKIFTGNSFYVKPGIYYRKQTDVLSWIYNSSADNWAANEKAEIEDIGINFRIGNQWQWDNFTLGCDWIGLSRTVSKLSETGNTEDLEVSGAALNFYLGLSF